MVRGSLGNVALSSSTVKGSYPLYAMPVPTLLSLESWVPHQDLRDAGKVVEMTADMLKEKDVIFVSHQWVAFNHPDPGGEQLRALQNTLTNLLNGKHNVESNSTLNTVYGTLDRFTPEMWKARLPEMFVWFDYSTAPSAPRTPVLPRVRAKHPAAHSKPPTCAPRKPASLDPAARRSRQRGVRGAQAVARHQRRRRDRAVGAGECRRCHRQECQLGSPPPVGWRPARPRPGRAAQGRGR